MKEKNKKNAMLVSSLTLGLLTLSGCGSSVNDTKGASPSDVPPFREDSAPTPVIKINEVEPSITSSSPSAPSPSGNSAQSKYKDGSYTVVTQYDSPAGIENMGITVVLKNDVVTETSFDVQAKAPRSVRYQEGFAAAYKALVIGKNIDTLSLSKVAGASLTSKGFDLALAQIKEKAK